MGFFSSRRAEPNPLSAERHAEDEHKSPVRIIRSKLYGKNKPIFKSASPPPSIQAQSDSSIAERLGTDCYINTAGQHSTLTLLSTTSGVDVRRSSSDVVTMTLAQRLNELAIANSDGLVDDNEYRLLRQSLFERFASASTVPSESHVVKTVAHKEQHQMQMPSTPSRKSNAIRSPSLRTQTSISSTMSSLFRRATRKAAERRPSKDKDNASVISRSSRTSMIPTYPPRPIIIPQHSQQLSRQPSSNSMNTVRSRQIPSDLRSISSKRSGRSQAALSDANSMSRGFSRGLRVTEPPPSSFHPKTTWQLDDDRLKTAADIRAEMRSVEAEERRLLDAFNGLEITAMASQQTILQNETPVWDAMEDRMPTAVGNSQGSMSRIKVVRTPSHSPYLRYSRPSVDEDPKLPNAEGLDDVRRRRADIADRYQERLAFLKARLKSAEMHERLLRK